jgi:antitoxin ParD1/3/4
MTTIDLVLSDRMKSWIDERIKSGPYSDAGDYLRELVRRDQEARERLVQALVDGESSGTSTRTVREIASDTRAKLDHGEL